MGHLIRLLVASLCAGALLSAHSETLTVSRAGGPGAYANLAAALQAYAAKQQCPADGVRIQVAAGTYDDEQLVLKSVPCPLTITGAGTGANRPKFQGHNDGTWLQVSAPGAGRIPLVIQGLEIADYQTAISINGNRNSAERWVGGVQIANNRFVRIGSPKADQTPSTAAVRFVNSRFNEVVGNEFESVRNAKSCGGLHSIYMAHMSSGNLVRNNRFVDGCGDTIKVRDQSNDNRVEGNVFERQEGNALLLDSYCDKQTRSDCSKEAGECPSWNNVFEGNSIRGARSPSNKKITNARRIESDLSRVCPPPPPNAVRIVEGGRAAAPAQNRPRGFQLFQR